MAITAKSPGAGTTEKSVALSVAVIWYAPEEEEMLHPGHRNTAW
jgi:hypothetical protein